MLLRPGGPALLNDAEPVALLSYAVRCLGPLDLSDATPIKLHEHCKGHKFVRGHANLFCIVPFFLKCNEGVLAGWESHLAFELADNFCFVWVLIRNLCNHCGLVLNWLASQVTRCDL